jgi:hypothetical protein
LGTFGCQIKHSKGLICMICIGIIYTRFSWISVSYLNNRVPDQMSIFKTFTQYKYTLTLWGQPRSPKLTWVRCGLAQRESPYRKNLKSVSKTNFSLARAGPTWSVSPPKISGIKRCFVLRTRFCVSAGSMLHHMLLTLSPKARCA